jgi:hypothetical protein
MREAVGGFETVRRREAVTGSEVVSEFEAVRRGEAVRKREPRCGSEAVKRREAVIGIKTVRSQKAVRRRGTTGCATAFADGILALSRRVAVPLETFSAVRSFRGSTKRVGRPSGTLAGGCEFCVPSPAP